MSHASVCLCKCVYVRVRNAPNCSVRQLCPDMALQASEPPQKCPEMHCVCSGGASCEVGCCDMVSASKYSNGEVFPRFHLSVAALGLAMVCHSVRVCVFACASVCACARTCADRPQVRACSLFHTRTHTHTHTHTHRSDLAFASWRSCVQR